MAGVEQPCYTLINFPTDSEPYNELQLKHDLGKLWKWKIFQFEMTVFCVAYSRAKLLLM